MRPDLKFRNYKIAKLRNPQRGYILITLMLAVALMAIAVLAMLPRIQQQIQRDREEEMCHRGTAYMRAIQHYYKKFGRYPSRIEELENTNNLRFLRKRYKDPLTGKDFKILHMQDVTLNNGPVLGQVPGGQPGQNIPGTPAMQGLLNQASQLSGQRQTASQTQSQSEGDSSSNNENAGNSPPNSSSGSSPSSSSPSSADSSSTSSNSSSATSNTGSSPGAGFGGQVFGGGPILGVASVSKAKTIREFNKKNHYNDWIFIYDPTSDRGGLLVGPWQPPTVGGLGSPGLGQPVQNMGQPQGFGQPAQGFGQGISQPPQQTPQNPSQNPGGGSNNQ
jgi:type II secretory pathway pseudopilin PulG